MSTVGSIADRAEAAPKAGELSFDAIRRRLPQREPFILIDRVLSLESNRRIVCIKNVSGSEPIFASHFPSLAIFPGAFLLEAMAQAALLLLAGDSVGFSRDDVSVPVLAGAKVRWLRPVRPGDQVTLSAEVEKRASMGALVSCQARVEQLLVARARLTVGMATLGE